MRVAAAALPLAVLSGCAPASPEPTVATLESQRAPAERPPVHPQDCPGFLRPAVPVARDWFAHEQAARRALRVDDGFEGLQAFAIGMMEGPPFSIRLEPLAGGVHRLRCVESDESLWAASYRGPGTPGRILRIAIDEASVQALSSAWAEMLRRVRPAAPHCGTGLDGVEYEISGPQGRGVTWSPERETPAGRLVWIVERLHEICSLGPPEREARLREVTTFAATFARGLQSRPHVPSEPR